MRISWMFAWLLLSGLWTAGVQAQNVKGTLLETGSDGSTIRVRLEDGEIKQYQVPSTVVCQTGLHGDLEQDITQHASGTYLQLSIDTDGKTIHAMRVLYPWYSVPAQWLDEKLSLIKTWFSPGSLFSNKQMLLGFISVLLVSLICGAVSSLVLSNRMAFFSDALAHFAFAGVALGILMSIAGWISSDEWIVPIMVLFGILSGCGIAYVKQKTVLANDTIIGVFFAGAMGLGAILLTAVAKIGGGGRGTQNPETFLFGDPMATTSQQIVYLLLLLLVTVVFLGWRYNSLVLASFNTSLARSRSISVLLGNYLFIIFLAMVVNACLKVVGALLINALLILPAATAGNISKTLRHFFWLTLFASLFAGVGGFLLSATWQPYIGGKNLPLSSGGVIVLLGTLIFFGSITLGPLLRGKRAISTTNV
ncbi:MAG TPA: metal ABC transporter permease [Gemmatales bacterium]|nr:metal ABC transporter permease [Gemmatales bacterium]